MAAYFATVARGLEALAAAELENLGAQQIEPGFCGVAFEGDLALLYRVNLWSRLVFRVLVKLGECPCRDAEDLYQGIQSIDWRPYLTPDLTFAVDATGKNRSLNHTHFTALQVKNAVVDQQRQHWGDRSTIDTQHPEVRLNVHIQDDTATVSLDSSGSSLHRRGYRPAVGAAPLKESLAAALVKLTDWPGDVPLLDPLCGSGTLPLEASMAALKIAPGIFREEFGFQTWLDFDGDLWDSLWQEAEAARKDDLGVWVGGCDRDPDIIQQARLNAQRCDLAEQINFWAADLADLEAPADSGFLLCNPPYGERLGADEDLGAFYKLLGNVMKQRFKGWTAFVLSGNKALSQHIGLKSAQRVAVYNGTLPCQWLKYELY
ncbi:MULTISPECIES: THUMP domain-containing protein [Cyanophyceae]|uniref:THUMP domain-containing class I SAM-dependent RNA methyltransferase n=1 Tax=Cyanophyceae TaxID=3028117 RepID=UPI0016858F41|nr:MULTISPECIES: THUMP domain-containing protein [Cyanophyceae]MBD1914919.1 RNA methyltransferase [Phormidium sp. FACHB-77]MBD2028597.1 RNA methyltransferase [Phormidium sp. FACHB-322]MBD2051759.1 RNA methyltransferase [Leptolyngbya sp. FACHB-60]